MKLTNQLVYVSATPAEFEIQNSIVGNAGYVPHKRARIGEDELVPFVLPGESIAAVYDRRTVGPARRLPASGSAGGAPALQLSHMDETPDKFDAHTPGKPLAADPIIRANGLLDTMITNH